MLTTRRAIKKAAEAERQLQALRKKLKKEWNQKEKDVPEVAWIDEAGRIEGAATKDHGTLKKGAIKGTAKKDHDTLRQRGVTKDTATKDSRQHPNKGMSALERLAAQAEPASPPAPFQRLVAAGKVQGRIPRISQGLVRKVVVSWGRMTEVPEELPKSSRPQPWWARRLLRKAMPSFAKKSWPYVRSEAPELENRGWTLPRPTAGQRRAIKILRETGENVLVDGCAGAGKSTTILHLARAMPGIEFLVLVHTKAQLSEMRRRARLAGVENVEILDYRGLGVAWYADKCVVDQGLESVVDGDEPMVAASRRHPQRRLVEGEGGIDKDYGVLVLDDAHTMTALQKRLVDKVLRDRGYTQKKTLKMVLTGDVGPLRNVCAKDGGTDDGADARFATLAKKKEVWGYVNSMGWSTVLLGPTMRVPVGVARFINRAVLGRDGMVAVLENADIKYTGIKARYVVGHALEDPAHEVRRLLGLSNMQPDDVLVVAPSLAARTPATLLVSFLSQWDVPVYHADGAEVNPASARGKVVVCTYAQARGLERRAVVVLGFDQASRVWGGDMAEDAPDEDANKAQLYVAMTRAREHLVVIHHHSAPPLKFLDREQAPLMADVVVTKSPTDEPPPMPRERLDVDELCAVLPTPVVDACLARLAVSKLAEPQIGVDVPPTRVIDRHGLSTYIEPVTATAARYFFQWHTSRGLQRVCLLVDRLLNIRRRQGVWKYIKLSPQIHQRLSAVRQSISDHRVPKSVVVTGDSKDLATWSILFFAAAERVAEWNTSVLFAVQKYHWFTDAHRSDLLGVMAGLGEAAAVPRGVAFGRRAVRVVKGVEGDVVVGALVHICRTRGGLKTASELVSTEVLSESVSEPTESESGSESISESLSESIPESSEEPPSKSKSESLSESESESTSKSTSESLPGPKKAPVWELTYAPSLTPSDVIRAAVKSYIFGRAGGAYLVSGLTGQVVHVGERTVGAAREALDLILAYRLRRSLPGVGKGTDAEFLEALAVSRKASSKQGVALSREFKSGSDSSLTSSPTLRPAWGPNSKSPTLPPWFWARPTPRRPFLPSGEPDLADTPKESMTVSVDISEELKGFDERKSVVDDLAERVKRVERILRKYI